MVITINSSDFFKEVRFDSDVPTATWYANCKAFCISPKGPSKTTEDIFYIRVESSVPRTRLTSARVEETSTSEVHSVGLLKQYPPHCRTSQFSNHACCRIKGFINGCHIDPFFKAKMIPNERLRRPLVLRIDLPLKTAASRTTRLEFSEISVALTTHDTCKGYWFVCNRNHQVSYFQLTFFPIQGHQFSPALASRTRMSFPSKVSKSKACIG